MLRPDCNVSVSQLVFFPFWDPVYFTPMRIQSTMFSEVLLSWWIYSSHVLNHVSYFYCPKTETEDRSLFSKIRCRYSICSCFDMLVTGKWQFWILELDFFHRRAVNSIIAHILSLKIGSSSLYQSWFYGWFWFLIIVSVHWTPYCKDLYPLSTF